MTMHVFCTTGGHSVEIKDADPSKPLVCPPGWALRRAEVIPAPLGPDDSWEPGIWYADPTSDTVILCCPEHDLIDTTKEEGLS